MPDTRRQRSTEADGGNDGRRNDGPDAWDLSYPAAPCIAGGDLFEPVGQFINLLLDGLPLIFHTNLKTHHDNFTVFLSTS